MNRDIVKEALLKLDELGGSDLIDGRWRKEVQTDILEYFPEISNEDLEYVLNLVLVD